MPPSLVKFQLMFRRALGLADSALEARSTPQHNLVGHQ
jgi:hypothetical protein